MLQRRNHTLSSYLLCELQILMNALKTIGVMVMELATTLQEVTTVVAVLDTQTVEAPAQVSYLSRAYLMMLTRLKNIKNVQGCRDGMSKSMQTR